MTSKSWHKFTGNIPSFFFNRTLRFLLLRIVCVSAVLLICSVPITPSVALQTCKDNPLNPSTRDSTDVNDPDDDKLSNFALKLHIYLYSVCSCTLLHHLASAFGPKFSLPGIIDFALIIAEIAAFFPHVVSGQWTTPFPRVIHYETFSCRVDVNQTVIPKFSAWFISISLALTAVMRIAEALKGNGRYFWARYDITGCKFTPTQGTRPNGFKVMTGVHLWSEHFTEEGKWLVLSRGIVALFLMIVAITFTISTAILDPQGEGAQLPVKVTRSITSSVGIWSTRDLYLMVGIVYDDTGNFSEAIKACIKVSVGGDNCPIYSDESDPTPKDLTMKRTFLIFDCGNPDLEVPFSSVTELFRGSNNVAVGVNYTALWRMPQVHRDGVQIVIGHIPDPSVVVRRTEWPVVLLPGANILGFARQHIEQRFRYPGLATLGISTFFDELKVSEITHLQPNSQGALMPISNETASLFVILQSDYTDLKTVAQYRDKSVLKALSSVGGLWTFLSFISGALFGSSLLRVAFGFKPLSITGAAHVFSEKTKQSYRNKYSNINPMTIDEGKDLDALIINHILDVDLFSEDPTPDAPETRQEQVRNDIESEGEKVQVDSLEDESSPLVTAAA